MDTIRFLLTAVCLISTLSGCGNGGKDASSTPDASSPAHNTPPTIAGNTPLTATIDQEYAIVPDVSDDDGDTLIFSISNQPDWLTLDTRTGRLSGTPRNGDVGNYSDIIISVSDGRTTVSLAPFNIDVVAMATGSINLTWQAPTLSEDATPLHDLAGYRVHWGTSPADYPNVKNINNPSVSNFLLEGLASGTYFIVVSAFDTSGNESGLSNVANFTIP